MPPLADQGTGLSEACQGGRAPDGSGGDSWVVRSGGQLHVVSLPVAEATGLPPTRPAHTRGDTMTVDSPIGPITLTRLPKSGGSTTAIAGRQDGIITTTCPLERGQPHHG